MTDPLALGAHWVVDVASTHGLDVTGAHVVRSGTATLVRLPGPGLLLRGWPPARAATARREVAVARLLAVAGVPVVPLVAGLDLPLTAPDGGAVTVWPWIEAAGSPATAAELGALTGQLRDATRSAVGDGGAAGPVPPFEPIEAAVAILGPSHDDAGADEVRFALAHLRPAWEEAEVADPCGVALVHGDLHAGNVLRGPDGLLLIDLELSGVGPASYDVTPAVVAVRRYGADPATLDAFLAARGDDPRGWPGFEVLVKAYELWVTAWSVAHASVSEAHREEADRRLAALRGRPSATWTLR